MVSTGSEVDEEEGGTDADSGVRICVFERDPSFPPISVVMTVFRLNLVDERRPSCCVDS